MTLPLAEGVVPVQQKTSISIPSPPLPEMTLRAGGVVAPGAPPPDDIVRAAYAGARAAVRDGDRSRHVGSDVAALDAAAAACGADADAAEVKAVDDQPAHDRAGSTDAQGVGDGVRAAQLDDGRACEARLRRAVNGDGVCDGRQRQDGLDRAGRARDVEGD